MSAPIDDRHYPQLPSLSVGNQPSEDRRSRSADDWFQSGVRHQDQGRLAEAEDAYREALALEPSHTEAQTGLAIVLAREGKHQLAENAFRRALDLCPEHAKAHNNFGVLLAELGRRKEAFEAWQTAARLDPAYPEAQFNFAMALAEQGETQGAVEFYERALHARPDYAEALNNLGLLHNERGRHHDAVILLEQALRLRPDYVEAWNNLALALVDLGRGDEAITAYREALRRTPNEPELHNNMGTALAAMNRPEEALACYRHALRLRPDYPEARWHQALTWLTMGDFEKGWREYEWRWRRSRSRPRVFSEPLWDGSPTAKPVLLWCEQGLGDSIQFIRYAALAKERVQRVIVECPPPLMPLFRTFAGIDELVPSGEPLPEFAAQSPLMSLPMIFGTSLLNVPSKSPYLRAEPDRIARWGVELAGALPASNVRIGIAWQGNPLHRWDRHRSFAVEWFADMARMSHISLVSLQKGTGIEQLPEFALRFPVLDLGARADPDGIFLDTPAIMANLDLVICCDTSLAHLAGALDIPVWVPLARTADWRWLRHRTDSPWYPSLRLFRQKAHGDWEEVFERIAAELASVSKTPQAER